MDMAALRPAARAQGQAFPSEACLASCSLPHLLSQVTAELGVGPGLCRLLSGAEQAPVVGEGIQTLPGAPFWKSALSLHPLPHQAISQASPPLPQSTQP